VIERPIWTSKCREGWTVPVGYTEFWYGDVIPTGWKVVEPNPEPENKTGRWIIKTEDAPSRNQWVPVDEALPELVYDTDKAVQTSDEVLAFDGEYIVVAEYESHNIWRNVSSCHEISGVTHWMPLPAPPTD